jgi:hypothetical protein
LDSSLQVKNVIITSAWGCETEDPHHNSTAIRETSLQLVATPDGHFNCVGIPVILEKPDRLAHSRLDMQGLDVLPIFLQQRDEEVDG